MPTVPSLRITKLNPSPLHKGQANSPADRQQGHQGQASSSAEYVLYWMTAFRRPYFNFALQRAVELSNELQLPLLVFEPLRLGYRWNCDRFHQFVLEGMADNYREFKTAGVSYLPYVERYRGEGAGLVERLVGRSAAVVSDDYPAFFLPVLSRRFKKVINVRWEAVDSNGVLPMRTATKVFSRAHFFRGFLQKNLLDHLLDFPAAKPLELLNFKSKLDLGWIPARYRQADQPDIGVNLSGLQIDHSVTGLSFRGGYSEAEKRLGRFLEERVSTYGERRNHPEEQSTSGLSGHLHFGHISSHQIVMSLMQLEAWTPDRIAKVRSGASSGWWGMSETVEGYLDQIITWRELGFNMAWQDRNYDKYDSLPEWAKKTMDEHRNDKREPCYELDEFDNALTSDPLWNAAQNQLREEGIIHNYLRMLWGKKILHWASSPEAAAKIMVELNNRYAIDGRDPNSYSGIYWTLGRYDRAWGPERPIFGKIRYMASENTARKFPVKNYIQRYGGDLSERTKSLF